MEQQDDGTKVVDGQTIRIHHGRPEPVNDEPHTRDEHCEPHVDPSTGCCGVCGVEQVDPCLHCGRRSFHADDCPTTIAAPTPAPRTSPAPWTWTDGFGRIEGKGEPKRDVIEGKPFAYCVIDSESFVVARCNGPLVTMSNERSVANVKVLAAALEMRDALRECVAVYEELRDAQPTGHLWPDPNHIHHARRAIEKAEEVDRG